MGRDRVLPQRAFGWLSERFNTPVFNIALCGVIGLAAIFLDVATSTSFINFGALEVMHRRLAIAHASGNRFNESHLTANLAELEVERGDPLSALDHIGLAIRYMHDSGNIVTVRSPMTNLAIFLDRVGQYEAGATIAGFAFSPLMAASFPDLSTAIAHLRDVLGDPAYESLAKKGASMTARAMATYAYDQIDQARTELEQQR